MNAQKKRVLIYVFDLNDGRNTDERLKIAAKRYCAEHGQLPEFASEEELFRVERTDRGKPYFPICPQLKVSVSHSGRYWVSALAEAEVGIDLQEHVKMKGESIEEAALRFQRMAHRFFHPVEAAFVEEDSYPRFFGVWAARESYVKYTGQGINASFSAHCVIPGRKEEQPLMNVENRGEIWRASGVSFWETRYRGDYTLCVCTKEACEIKFA